VPAAVPAAVCCCWVGQAGTPALAALQLALSGARWLCCAPAFPGPGGPAAAVQHGLSSATQALLKRRWVPGSVGCSGCETPKNQKKKMHNLKSAGGCQLSVFELCRVGAGRRMSVGHTALCFLLQRSVLPHAPHALACRVYLVEKTRGAAILGLLVGTLASPGLTRAMAQMRALVPGAGMGPA
jgi:hypothetical protein